jgi:class 3 adenylate cyclase
MNAEIDVRHVLPSIHVPTLVLYREGEYLHADARYMGERIPAARIVELSGADHLPWEGEQSEVLGEIERFAGHLDARPEPERVLVTVLVVEADGTQDACDLVRADVARFRGSELALTDNTLIASFDGPARAIRCGTALMERARTHGRAARAGLHTGESELGADALEAFPVAIAAALKQQAEPGEILVSSTVRDLVAGSGLAFSEHEREPLRVAGVPGSWRVHAVVA